MSVAGHVENLIENTRNIVRNLKDHFFLRYLEWHKNFESNLTCLYAIYRKLYKTNGKDRESRCMKTMNNVETVVSSFRKVGGDISATSGVCSMSFFWVEIATSQFRGRVHLDRYVCVVGWSSIEA